MEYNFSPIGQVRSTYQQKFGTPRQPGLVKQSRAFVAIEPRFQPELSLMGLRDYSHMWIIFVFHRNDNLRFRAKVHPPRLRGETMGLFATRTPHRPNPIGLSLVEIESVEADGVWVRGVDLMDETPVLDIKPYLPEVEAKPEAKMGWTDKVADHAVEFEWLASAEKVLMAAQQRQPQIDLREMIEETVALDPRPLVYQAEGGGESEYRDSHVMRIADLDVHFNFKDYQRAVITRVVPLSSGD
jgi:tRNA-Thr(GGU) m(6)t(6)A37 methyltransferase TsaA